MSFRRLSLIVMLLFVLAACGETTAPQPGPDPTPAPTNPIPEPDEAEDAFSASITWDDPERDAEVYLKGNARTFVSQGKRVIEAKIDDFEDELTLTIVLPDLDQTQYSVGQDLEASIVYAMDAEVVFKGNALEGDMANVRLDPSVFLATTVLEFDGFSLGASIGFPR